MIFVKYCKECKQAYDISINYDKCHQCRSNKKKKHL